MNHVLSMILPIIFVGNAIMLPNMDLAVHEVEQKDNKIGIEIVEHKDKQEISDDNEKDEYVKKYTSEERKTVLKTVCMEKGFENEKCPSILEAMIIKESRGNPYAVGDNGRSHGYYQIQIVMHKISRNCAIDLECSSRWTLNNLIYNGYPNDIYLAVKRHNGDGAMADRYANHVLYMASQI